MKSFILFSLLAALFFGCDTDSEKAYLFTQLNQEDTGLDFTNEVRDSEALGILYYLYFYNGGGVAVGDVNNDGLPDVFFTGNQVPNRLFLNKGGLKFEDVTPQAGVAGKSDWNTGVAMADVNGDGFLDIYVCAVVGIHGLNGKNELYINNGDLTFTEQGEKYQLDFRNYSTSAAFFDYDNDGDLDMYLLNHSIHTESSYGPAEIRNIRDEKSGDKLLRNDGGKYVDVSEEAGIYGGANGYGLGVATADFNNDGWTDLYISNDFHEDDYYYLNQGDGTFAEQLKEKFGQTSRFSMGNDVSDINHDGFMDLMTLDMLPEDEVVLKSSMGDDAVYTHDLKIERLKYHPQYARNMLQINHQGEYFQETALFSGVEATDWSWSPLFADFDMDGRQDLFVSTGIPRRPNDHDYIAYISSEDTEREFNNTSRLDQKALEKMPAGIVKNFLFRGEDELKFSDQTGKWMTDAPVISNGAAWADFDLDGDLDMITNNTNSPATLYRNNSPHTSNYLKLDLRFHSPNTFGIGTKVISWHGGTMQVKQQYPARGFQSSSEPIVHFGYGNVQTVDSLQIIWPDNTFEMKYSVATNQHLQLSPGDSRKPLDYQVLFPSAGKWFEKVDISGLDYIHQENRYIDFNRQKLIPYKISDRGPAVGVRDINHDGKDDVFFGGAKNQKASIYYQTANGFELAAIPTLEMDSLSEDVSVTIDDFNGDGKMDLFIVSGGGEAQGDSPELQDRLLFQMAAGFDKEPLPPYFENGAVVKSCDYDRDGDLDLFIGGAARANDFGKTPFSYLLENQQGAFGMVENDELRHAGMITDAVWTDFNQDGWIDLIVVGEWMAPRFFQNEQGRLVDRSGQVLQEGLNGLWQAILPFDVNEDGQMDYLVGNWGLNSKFSASQAHPLKMYYGDFDSNGSTETILAQEKGGKYFTLAGLAELGSQLSYLKKKFTSHGVFAGRSLQEIFGEQDLESAQLMTVEELASGYLLNSGGSFTFQSFDSDLQIAPIKSFLPFDFDNDGKVEVLAGGNYFGVSPYHGRLGSFAGQIISSSAQGIVQKGSLGLDFTQNSVRSLDILEFNGDPYLMATFHNQRVETYRLLNW